MSRNLIDFGAEDDVRSVAGSVYSEDLYDEMSDVTPPPPDVQQQQPVYQFFQPPPPNFFPPPPPVAQLKLNEFWMDAPVAWFGTAEAQFTARRITGELDKFCAVVAALPREAAKPVSHMLANPDPVLPYTKLKQAMLASHELTPFQKMEKLMATPPLGDRTASQLLQDMLELCPNPAEAGHELFAFMFLHRLPRELRVLVAHEDHTDLRQLASIVDHKKSYSTQQPHEAGVATVAAEGSVAAVAGQNKPWQKKKKPAAASSPSSSLPSPLVPTAAPPPVKKGASKPKDLAQLSSGLCYYHWNFGDKATLCKGGNCSWQGN
jgi:hypothetical protein